MVRIKTYRGNNVFEALAQEWDPLAQQGMTDTPFQSLAYQQAWWNHLGPGDLHTIAVRDESAHLLGIACFYLLEGVLYFNGCVEETDYLDLVAKAENADSVWRAVFEHLCSSPDLAWNEMSLCNIPDGSPSLEILETLAAELGLDHKSEQIEVCPIIDLPATFEAYLDSLDGKQRHELRRKLRRADGAGAELTVIGPDDDLRQAVEDFLLLLQQSTIEKKEWLNEGRRAVFHDVAQEAHSNGTLQLMFLQFAGQNSAALFNFKYDGRIWVYNSGLDPTSFYKLSPGVVLTTKAIKLAIEDGYQSFDFLRGSEEYKYRFGAADTRIFRINLSRS